MKPLVLALLGVGLVACAGDLSPTEEPNACSSDAECGPGQVCYESGCGSALDYTVRVTPQGGGLAVQDFNRVSVALGRVNLTLQPPAQLAGKVRITSAQGLSDYAALGSGCTQSPAECRWSTVTARGRSSSIPGLAFEQAIVQTILSGADFSLQVPAGIWQVSVAPADPDIPPVFSRRVVASGDLQDPQLILSGENLLQIRGYIKKDDATPWTGTQLPVFRVQALDPVSGDPLSQPRVVQASDELQLSTLRVSGRVAVQIGPDPSSPVPAPSKEFLSDPTGAFPEGFALGDYGAPVEVTGTVVDPLGRPIPSAAVRFEGIVNGGGRFTATATTLTGAQAGRFSILVLPSRRATETAPAERYAITASPPPDSPYAEVRLTLEVGAAGALPQPVACPPKSRLTAQLRGPDGLPLPNVVVHYEGSPASSAPGKSSGDTKTDASGVFSVLVEPGIYRVLVRPGADRRLPWVSRTLQAVEPSGSVPTPEVIQVTGAREIFGAVTTRGASGEAVPVPSARVVVYPASTVTGPIEPPAPVPAYEALSDSRGEFRMFLPVAQ